MKDIAAWKACCRPWNTAPLAVQTSTAASIRQFGLSVACGAPSTSPSSVVPFAAHARAFVCSTCGSVWVHVCMFGVCGCSRQRGSNRPQGFTAQFLSKRSVLRGVRSPPVSPPDLLCPLAVGAAKPSLPGGPGFRGMPINTHTSHGLAMPRLRRQRQCPGVVPGCLRAELSASQSFLSVWWTGNECIVEGGPPSGAGRRRHRYVVCRPACWQLGLSGCGVDGVFVFRTGFHLLGKPAFHTRIW